MTKRKFIFPKVNNLLSLSLGFFSVYAMLLFCISIYFLVISFGMVVVLLLFIPIGWIILFHVAFTFIGVITSFRGTINKNKNMMILGGIELAVAMIPVMISFIPISILILIPYFIGVSKQLKIWKGE